MAKRTVDRRKTNKALRKLRRAAERATQAGGAGLTNWEKDFVEGVSTRLETYGSAFRDPAKGRLEEALSQRQAEVARVIERKSRKAAAADRRADDKSGAKPPRATLKRKSPPRSRSRLRPALASRDRDINNDASPATPESPEQKRASLKVIPGGKPD